jgi:hypothetical protein
MDISEALIPLLGRSFGTARSGQGRAGFARRSGPFHEKVTDVNGKDPFVVLPFALLSRAESTRVFLSRPRGT